MNVDKSDLEEIFRQSKDDLSYFDKARIFITGGTGYVGKWMIEFLHYARERACLQFEIVLLSRNIQRFLKQYPHFKNESWLSYIEGDVRSFPFPKGSFSHIIHAATDIATPAAPLETFEVTSLGTQRVLDFAIESGARELLLISSGAAYGAFPKGVDRISEAFPGRVDVSSSEAAYGLGKLTAEWLSNIYVKHYNLRYKTARMFSQIGPHLALNSRFAIGNFIKSTLDHSSLTIKGDGTPTRSYMYATDLIVWLLRIWAKGKPGSSYNVGSEEAISLRDLATLVANIASHTSLPIRVFGHSLTGAAPNYFVPDTTLAQQELNLSITVPLEEAIQRTIRWHRRRVSQFIFECNLKSLSQYK